MATTAGIIPHVDQFVSRTSKVPFVALFHLTDRGAGRKVKLLGIRVSNICDFRLGFFRNFIFTWSRSIGRRLCRLRSQLI